MLKRGLSTSILAITLALALGFGLFRLFAIRWEIGDVYPAYSSLRADPLGTRVFFESVDALPQFEAQRNYRPLQHLRPEAPITLLYAAVPRSAAWGSEELRHFETLVANGSRAVFAFNAADLQPETRSRVAEKPKEETTSEEKGADKPDEAVKTEVETKGEAQKPNSSEPTSKAEKKEHKAGDTDEERRSGARLVQFSEVADRWGFRFDVATGKRAGSFHGVATAVDSDTQLEPKISWHSALRFADLQPAWRVLYRAAGEPVVIERRWGDGTIILAADTFFLSNEALQNERSPEFLAWLIGSPRTLVFDEEHLGVSEDIGLISLARKYRLHGAFAALAVVALLWLWRQSVRFVPADASNRSANEFVAGLDSHAGFVSLLRRTVPPARSLEVCVEEWRKTFSHDKRAQAIVNQALSEAMPANARKSADPITVYQAIARALKQQKSR